MSLPKQLYRAEQVRALDRVAIDSFNIPGIDLMENAGAATFRAMRESWPRAQHIAVFCGAGNNAGDGFVIARLAHEAELLVTVYMLADTSRLKGDAKLAYEKLQQTPVKMLTFDGTIDDSCDVIVDALLGTGLMGDVKDQWKLTIEAINHYKDYSDCHLVAVDIPSGLHADTGSVLGAAVKADMTVTFIGLKQGLLTGQGPDYCGELVFDDLKVPPETYEPVDTSVERITKDEVFTLLRSRPRCAHKGSHGHVLVIGGNKGMIGAARMAGEAALRSGAGLVTVVTRPEHVNAIVSARPELMCHGVENKRQLKPLLHAATCIAIGPGLGQDAWAQELLSAVLETLQPIVMDADALNLLSREPVIRANWVLTPHPGEASRLLDMPTSEIQQDRFATVSALQSRYGGVVVLKGCGTLVCHEDQSISLCDAGNPGMAVGGMGDMLTGIMAACIAQSQQLNASANVSIYIHAKAADLAAAGRGERGLLASDLLPHIQKLVNPA